MGVRARTKADWLGGLGIHDLPIVAPDDPRTLEAVEIAKAWWEHERSST
jgi:hypothetical protein